MPATKKSPTNPLQELEDKHSLLTGTVKILSAKLEEHFRRTDVYEKRIKDLERHASLTIDRISSLETSYKWKKDEYRMLKALYDALQRPVYDTMKIVDTIRDYLMAQPGYDPENPSKPYDKAASTSAAVAYLKEPTDNPYASRDKK